MIVKSHVQAKEADLWTGEEELRQKRVILGLLNMFDEHERETVKGKGRVRCVVCAVRSFS